VKVNVTVDRVKYGKKITVIEITPAPDREELKELLRFLKRRLGTGGYLDGDKIILQGDQSRGLLMLLFEALGHGEPA